MPTAKVNGIDIAYETHGEGEPLLLAHFSSASKEMWEEQLGPFSQRYRVIVYDVRGHVESAAPPAGDAGYTMDNLVEDQHALLEHLGIEQAFVGGISMGGAIALRFALKHPELVRALLLCDTTADIADTTGGEPMPEPDIAAAMVYIKRKGLTELTRKTWLAWAAPLGITTEEQLPAGPRRHIERAGGMSADSFVGCGRALSQHTSVLACLPGISVPTLVLTGEHDFLRSSGERLKERMPAARFVLIRDAAHITSFWQPERFTAAVLDFLGDVGAGRPVAGYEER